jgi:hypothetical protein
MDIKLKKKKLKKFKNVHPGSPVPPAARPHCVTHSVTDHLQSNDVVFCFERCIVSWDIFNAAPQVSLFIKTRREPPETPQKFLFIYFLRVPSRFLPHCKCLGG